MIHVSGALKLMSAPINASEPSQKILARKVFTVIEWGGVLR